MSYPYVINLCLNMINNLNSCNMIFFNIWTCMDLLGLELQES